MKTFSLVTDFDVRATEAEVEQKFVYPLLVHSAGLGILPSLVKPQSSIEASYIEKGQRRRRYAPDHLVYAQGYPVLVIENKRPSEDLETAAAEAQLYAVQINSKWPAEVNPIRWILACNGLELLVREWDSNVDVFRSDVSDLSIGSHKLTTLRMLVGSDQLQNQALTVQKIAFPSSWYLPYERLGQNRVHLTRVGHNAVFELISPILRDYFDPKNEEYEERIIKEAYVNTEAHTRYERTFENFIREKIVPRNDESGVEIETTKKSAFAFEASLKRSVGKNSPYLQLIIGSVGSGKTSFIKRFFDVLLPEEMAKKIIFVYVNFNNASDDLSDLDEWLADEFIRTIRSDYSNIVDLGDERIIEGIFSSQIKNNRAAYNFLKKAGIEKYYERLAADVIEWTGDSRLFAREICRYLSGDRGLTVVVALDNVDRRSRDAQLKIFQSGQSFMQMTRSVCIMTLRDETYELYKGEKPLDAFSKTLNFYIRPPRFTDMVQKRIELALRHHNFDKAQRVRLELPGLASLDVPQTQLGTFLTSVYVDLFRGKRHITIILEGLARRNAREALEMFSAILTSAHFPADQFTASGLTSGLSQIKEASLLKSLMRTSYLYFTPDHGFVKNIFASNPSAGQNDYFLKYCIVDWLIENRKRPGDVRIEGYFTVSFVRARFSEMDFSEDSINSALSDLLSDELIVSDRLIVSKLEDHDTIRVTASGYVHARTLCARKEYIAACALVTPVVDRAVADQIGALWQISDYHIDARSFKKNEAGEIFLNYLRAFSYEGKSARSEQEDRLLSTVEAALSFGGIRTATSLANQVDQQDEFESKFVG